MVNNKTVMTFSVVSTILVLVAGVFANTASAFWFHQPRVPKSLRQ